MSDETAEGFYILSLKWSEGRECATWWGPNLSGYSMFLENAGVYTREEVDKQSLNDGVNTMAIPEKDVRGLARRSVHCNDWNRIIAARIGGINE